MFTFPVSNGMKIHRFIIQTPITKGKILLEETELVFQIQKVLRLELGEYVTLTDGHGTEAHAQIERFLKGAVEVTVETISHQAKTKPTLHGYIAVLKKDNLELAVQKMTELGITNITPIITTRTVKKNYNHERLEKIIKEAIEQSGQSILPVLHSEKNLMDAIQEAQAQTDIAIVFDQPNIETKIPTLEGKSVSFFVGPEGGWTEDEKALFKKEKVLAVSLGDTTLRGETAGIVGTFWIHERQ